MTRLASKGPYALLWEAEDAKRRRMADQKSLRRSELLEQQQLEWRAFEDARVRVLDDARTALAMDGVRRTEDLHHKYTEMCKAHEEEMEAYASNVDGDAMRRPVVLSPLVTNQRKMARRLMSVGRYADAQRVHETSCSLEQMEREAARERISWSVARKLMEKQQQLDARGLYSYSKMFRIEQLEKLRAEEELRATESRIRHRETEMAMAHRRQRRALDAPPLDFHAFSKASVRNATRGTRLGQRARGDHYHVPSLCNLYGSLLEQE